MFALGGIACVLGLSVKAVHKLDKILTPHQLISQRMINYGASATYIGLFCAGSGVLIAKTVGEYLADKEFNQRIDSDSEQELTPKSECSNCIYYSPDSFLNCAVNPGLPKNCKDFTPKS